MSLQFSKALEHILQLKYILKTTQLGDVLKVNPGLHFTALNTLQKEKRELRGWF